MSLAANLAGGLRQARGVFTLDQFGWTDGREIGRPLESARDAVCDLGYGLIQLPAGTQVLDREVVFPRLARLDQHGIPHGMMLQGMGEDVTQLYLAGGTSGLRFEGDPIASGGAYCVSPTIRDLTIQGVGWGNGQDGLTLYECVRATVQNVHVLNCERGIVIPSTGNDQVTQDTRLWNVHSQGNRVGFAIEEAAEIQAVGCHSNQNIEKGWHIKRCSGMQISGGLIQDSGVPVHVEPAGFNGIELTIVGSTYLECPVENVIRIDSAPQGHGTIGTVNLVGGYASAGGKPFADGAFVSARDCSLRFDAVGYAQGWECLLRARFMDTCIVVSNAQPSRFDIDADSLTRARMIGPYLG